MKYIFLILLIFAISGCAGMKLSEKGLEIDKDTSATIEDLGVGSMTKKF